MGLEAPCRKREGLEGVSPTVLHSCAEETPAPVPPQEAANRLLPREPEWAAMTESEKELKINRMRRKSRSGGGKQSSSHPPAPLPSLWGLSCPDMWSWGRDPSTGLGMSPLLQMDTPMAHTQHPTPSCGPLQSIVHSAEAH